MRANKVSVLGLGDLRRAVGRGRVEVATPGVEALNPLWILRRSAAHNPGVVSSPDAARLGATVRANQLDQPIFSAWPWVIAALVGLLVPACGGTNSIEMDAGLDVGASPDAAEPDMGLRPPCARMVPLRLWVTDPSAVAMLYRLETCDGESMTLVPGDGESVFDYYSLTENGQSLSSEAVPFIEH